MLDSTLKVSGEHDERDEELDAEDKLENDAATEISTQIRRVLDGIRTYPPGHVTLKGYRSGLLEKLTAQLQEEEEYSLRVTPMGFSTETRIVNKAEKLTDSITHPLYLDGVQLFTVKRPCRLTETIPPRRDACTCALPANDWRCGEDEGPYSVPVCV